MYMTRTEASSAPPAVPLVRRWYPMSPKPGDMGHPLLWVVKVATRHPLATWSAEAGAYVLNGEGCCDETILRDAKRDLRRGDFGRSVDDGVLPRANGAGRSRN